MQFTLINLMTWLNLSIPIHARSEWTNEPYPTTNGCSKTQVPFEIVIHHTATPTEDKLSTSERLNLIRKSHIAREFCDIGYHYLIDRRGEIWRGVPSELIRGSHVKGINTGRIGISVIGNYDVDRPNKLQIAALSNLVNRLSRQYKLGKVKVHKDYSNTVCAGKYLIPECRKLRR